MKLTQHFIHIIRTHTPLTLRKLVGPWVAYVVYFFRIHVHKDKREPTVLSIEETLERVNIENLSVIRFGDGELSLIQGTNLPFQNSDPLLAKKLLQILQSDIPGLLICISGFWDKLDIFTKEAYRFNLHHLFKYRHVWLDILPQGRIYGNAYLTRPYLFYKDKNTSSLIFSTIMSLWKNKDVVLIEGEKSRLGVGNNLFQETSSLERILCPAENAFAKYAKILETARKIPQEKLILISLGPTAKVLAYDLYMSGYRVLDIGHIDMEYEMFLRGETKLVKVNKKYFNEINERTPDECTDGQYLSEIKAHIL